MPDQSTHKIITVTENESRRFLAEMIKYEADKIGAKVMNFAGGIIEEAIKNQADYDKPLSRPIKEQDSKKITIKIKAEYKRKFADWAKEKNRSQARHAAFILEKWCEINKVTPASCELS